MHKAFKPMVREHAYDASEMALVTYLQAKAYNKGLTLLPAAMLARFQHGTMLYNAERGKLEPADLPGCRIGVRSYSQTTGAWIRGILENDYARRSFPRAVGDLRGRPCRRGQGPSGVIRARERSGHDEDADRRRARCRDLRRRPAEGPAPAKRDPGSGGRGARLVRQARLGAGQSHGGGDRGPGAREPAGGRRALPAAGSGQEGAGRRCRPPARSIRRRSAKRPTGLASNC